MWRISPAFALPDPHNRSGVHALVWGNSLNFALAILREDGKMHPDVTLTQMIRHLVHMIEHPGGDRVGFGSDHSVAVVPEDRTSCADRPKLRDAMQRCGYGEELIAKLCHGNWLRVLERTRGQ